MLSRNWVAIGIATIVLSLMGCSSIDTETTVIKSESYNQELADLFPNQPGFRWQYDGTGDYEHFMVLDKIYEANSQKVLKLSGETYNASIGGSVGDYGLEVTYAIENNRIVQTMLSDTMMDSEYDHMTLIMTPLNVGTSWTEETIDSQGKKTVLKGEIIGIEKSNEGFIYEVIYKEAQSDYSEVRKIQVGKGVVEFVKTVKYDQQSLEFSYQLTKMDLTTMSDATSESTEKERVKGVIFKYDELWIDFVNQGETDLMRHVIEDSPVEEMIKNYTRDGSKHKYLSIEIGDISINKDKADASVYEKIQIEKNGEIQIYEYHWLYHLQKKGEQWYVHSYDER